MPQMAPLWWTTIMMMTISLMMIMIMINYFNFNKSIIKTFKPKINMMKWMW